MQLVLSSSLLEENNLYFLKYQKLQYLNFLQHETIEINDISESSEVLVTVNVGSKHFMSSSDSPHGALKRTAQHVCVCDVCEVGGPHLILI